MDSKEGSLPGVDPISPARAARYRAAGLWRGQTLARAILDAARRQPPARPALIEDDRHVTFGALIAAVRRLAEELRGTGIGRHDRIIVQLPNGEPLVVLTLALWRLGAIAVMALPAYREHELNHIAATSGAMAIAVPSGSRRATHLDQARALRDRHDRLHLLLVVGQDGALGSEPDGTRAADPGRPAGPGSAESLARPEDVAMLLMSGGTTGLPKLIPRTHDDYVYNLQISGDICQVDASTIYLAALPATHNFALGCPGVMGTLIRGGQVVFPRSNHPRAMLEAAARHRVTLTAVVPALAVQWAEAATQHGLRPPHQAMLQVGGARLLPDAARQVSAALGCGLQQVYGMAEGLLNFTRPGDPEDVVLHTQGRPASPDDEIRIVDEAGNDVAPGELGELWTRGPYTIAGYFRAEAQNATSFTPDGFYRTGDLVRRHLTGNLVVEGRIKDVINRSGEKIGAAELEGMVLAHPAVAQAAVVAMPDDHHGEAICAYAVLRPGSSLSLHELREFLVDRGLARFKLPDRLEAVSALPLTPVGKIDKGALRAAASLLVSSR